MTQNNARRLFTSESVTEGHPDKISDQISDAILDKVLTNDPNARVSCETIVSTGLVLVTGEMTTSTYVDIDETVRETIRNVGYDRAKYGFDADTCAILTSIDEQSPDISQGVDEALEAREGNMASDAIEAIGAGDQGILFGYASNETPELMPLPVALAHKLSHQLAEVRKQNIVNYLRPDGKTQVTVEYDEDDQPKRIDTIVISTQHHPDVTLEQMTQDLKEHVIEETVPAGLIDADTRYLINPTGRFVIGGPQGDTGLTGRKLIVDTYGGFARHGGGAFSGKDPTKVDRSAAYAARYVAKNLVAAGLAETCEIQLAYAIGVAEPVSIYVNTMGTGQVSETRMIELIRKYFDLRPAGIIQMLDLRRPIYLQTAAYGHFGRTDVALPWEMTDKAEALKQEI